MGLVFEQLLILMVVIWTAAVVLRRFGLPTIMGELTMGVVLGPAVLGWVEPNETIEIMAQLGIFFLMLHAGVETEPSDFFAAVKASLGVALAGALVPFLLAFGAAAAFGLDGTAATFVGLTMSATAVVVTLKMLRDLDLKNTRMARVLVASCVINDLLALIMFSIVLGVVQEGGVSLASIFFILLKVGAFFCVVIVIGRWLYPLFRHPFRSQDGKGFAFLLVLGLGFGLFAELIGLHIILGAYLAGLFFRKEVAKHELIQKVEDRLNGIAYTFLGPIFFISLGFHITFEPFAGWGLGFAAVLTTLVVVGQILGAGGMARRLKFSWIECGMIGIGMCGRAEMAFILSSLGLSLGVIDTQVFSVLIFATFLLNLIAPSGLKACSVVLNRRSYALGEPPPTRVLDRRTAAPDE